MNLTDLTDFFKEIVTQHVDLQTFVLRSEKLKEENRSKIQYPCLVLDEIPGKDIIGQQDTYIYNEASNIMILCKAQSQHDDNIITAFHHAENLVNDVLSYILTDSSNFHLEPENYDIVAIFNQKIQPVYKYSSDRLFGYQFKFYRKESPSLEYNPTRWLGSI